LRSEVQQVINEQNRESGSTAFKSAESTDDFSENDDEVQELTEIFQLMEDVIRERTELLESSNRQLDEASRAKGMYLTNMSHELRTPLNAIIGFTEVLLESAGDERLSAYQIDRLGRILKSGRHLLELINSLLDLSKIEEGQMEIQQTNFQLENLLQDVMEGLEPLLQEKSIEHELIFQHDQQFLLFSDAGKVRQVLINILANAIKFTDPGGRIEIRCTKHENGFDLAIKDSGCGMSEEQQQHIFKMFHQVKTTVIAPQNGTGLGLALVQSLMELLDATVSLKSTLGEGSTFTLHFPAS
jgi:signal transduction histidine kinase